jgi:hypothetical protein
LRHQNQIIVISALMGGLASTASAQGPVAWYSFDTQGNVGLDSVGTNNGTPVNVTQVPGVIGQAASFQNGYIALPTSAVFQLRSGDFTLAVFVKGTPGNGNRNWFTKGTNIGGGLGVHQYGIGGSSTIGMNFDGGAGGSAISATNVFDGQWHHVAGIKRGNTAEIWIDGKQEGTGTITGSSDQGGFAIGRMGQCCEYFNGQMDEAKIWNRALSSTEIMNEAAALSVVSSRTLLVTFTGGNTAPDGSICLPLIDNQVVYTNAELLYSGRGMTNLLVNAQNVAPSAVAQAFTFYSGGGNSCLPPPAGPHVEAQNWVLGTVKNGDRLIIAGHSFGGNRARLFAEQIDAVLYPLYGLHMIEGLVLVDPIDWSTCPFPSLSCLQRFDPPRDVPAGVVKPERAFVFRQGVDNLLTLVPYEGYSITVGGQPVQSTDINMGHKLIDSAEPVQRFILNLLQPPQPVTAPGVTLQLSLLSVTRDPTNFFDVGQRFTFHFVARNAGRLIADNITVTSVSSGITTLSYSTVIRSQPLLPGSNTTLDLSCDGLISGSALRLSVLGTYNNFTFGGSFRVTLP